MHIGICRSTLFPTLNSRDGFAALRYCCSLCSPGNLEISRRMSFAVTSDSKLRQVFQTVSGVPSARCAVILDGRKVLDITPQLMFAIMRACLQSEDRTRASTLLALSNCHVFEAVLPERRSASALFLSPEAQWREPTAFY